MAAGTFQQVQAAVVMDLAMARHAQGRAGRWGWIWRWMVLIIDLIFVQKAKDGGGRTRKKK